MQKLRSNWMLAVAATAAVALSTTRCLHAEEFEKTKQVAGTTVHYKVVLPHGFNPATAYPAVLALGGGPQTMNTVDGVLGRNFRAEAEKRGYIVVAPAAPDGRLFFQEGARIFPEFLKMILADYKIRDGKFHIAGPSNGGIAALHIAAANPEYFLSVTAFPGYMWQPSAAKLDAISKMCVFMYVGELDEYMWHDEMEREAAFLRAEGTVARYTVEKGQPHRMDTLAGANAARLFDGFEETKKGCSQTLDLHGRLTYFIDDGTGRTGYRAGDRQLAEWALQAWQRSAAGGFRLEAAPASRALVGLYWAEPSDGQYGEMRSTLVDGRRGAHVFIRPDMNALGPDIAGRASADPLLRDSIVYLTCLHEIGHALGLMHTADVSDIMYFFGFGGDIVQYFGRYRAQLHARNDIPMVSGLSPSDERRLRVMYARR
jgi:hypothetical protein